MLDYLAQLKQLTANSDWSKALAMLKSQLNDDLFAQLVKTCEISTFVKQVFLQYPQLTGELLKQQIAVQDKVYANQLNQQIASYFLQFDSLDNSSDDSLDEAAMMRQLRIIRKTHSAVIAFLELNNKLDVCSGSFRISTLANQLIRLAYEWCHHQLAKKYQYPVDEKGERQNLLVVAMGKLGGQELNFSSDIDLIFFHADNNRFAAHTTNVKSIGHADFFRRLAQLLIRLLDQITQDGFVFRVDMRLRPFGSAGPLAMSFTQAEDYYQQQGREWERFAMLRARPVTANDKERKSLDDIIRPFSFRRYIDYGVFDSIRNMKSMIERELRRKDTQQNIKLGAGGIREVEFVVQSFQLIQGGRNPQLTEKNIIKVLPLLAAAGLLSSSITKQLAQSYQFLRKIENTIQQFSEEQTHLLPQNIQQQQALIEVMGFANWQKFMQQLQSCQQAVHKIFSEIFSEQKQNTFTQEDFYILLAEGQLDAQKLLTYVKKTELQKIDTKKTQPQKTQQLTLQQSEVFIQQVDDFLQDKILSSLSDRGVRRLKKFFPAILAACLQQTDPVLALQGLLKIIKAILKRTAYLELLSENPPILNHLVELSASSPWIVERLSSYPVLLDELLYPSRLYQPLQSHDLKAELDEVFLRIAADDEEAILEALRVFKQTNELRLAAALLTERLNISQVNVYLTQLAEAILTKSLALSWGLLSEQYDLQEKHWQGGDGCGFAIIAYGKLGGSELGFGSDLDLVFLVDAASEQPIKAARTISQGRFYLRVAQKLIHLLSIRTNSGVLYEIDLRLRPSGSSGLLVSSLAAFEDYQNNSAWTWEHQALIRARFIAGDKTIQRSFQKIRQQILVKPRDQQDLKQQVVAMRDKMRNQAKISAVSTGSVVSANSTINWSQADLKQQSGGMLDIEFMAQYFCLACQADVIKPYNTVGCLRLAGEQKLLQTADADKLIEYYHLYRDQLNRQTLLADKNAVKAESFQTALNFVKEFWYKTFA